MSLNDKFRTAAENIKKLKEQPGEDELLEIYALYKQAEIGDCNIRFLNVVSKKWTNQMPKCLNSGFSDFLDSVQGFLFLRLLID
ncbi:hypothetical protein RUM43_013608 [Polyplax serrata]|uniref:ACB domain-containing protein n=1 Tax=Polyplax serrata TaxID=468196 RepID=A0AAN8PBQ5_POLSC